jgi:RNA polymerase sigma-70 factor (ECF subfamily)
VDALLDVNTIDRARAGDRESRAALLHGLQDPWYRLCLALLRDADRAREATQESAVRFLRQLPGFRGDSQLRTWALGIAINVAREMRRRGGRRETDLPDEQELAAGENGSTARAGGWSPTAPDDAAEAAEWNRRLHEVLAELPQRQREAVVLRFFEELSVEQTAAAMSCAAGTVKATVHQALRALRQRLCVLV